MATKVLNPTINITPGTTGSYVDIDVSGYVSATATGVYVAIYETAVEFATCGVRKNGSTDDFKWTNNLGGNAYTGIFTCVGLDENKIFEVYVSNANVRVYLRGYFESEATFFTNAYNIVPSGSAEYLETDLSSYLPSGTKFAIFWLGTNPSAAHHVRPHGSTDVYYNSTTNSCLIVAVDENRHVDIYTNDLTNCRFRLIGYFSMGWNKTNYVSVRPVADQTWLDIDRSSDSDALAGRVAVIMHLETSVGANYSMTRINESQGGFGIFTQSRIQPHLVELDTDLHFDTWMAYVINGYYGSELNLYGYLPGPTVSQSSHIYPSFIREND